MSYVASVQINSSMHRDHPGSYFSIKENNGANEEEKHKRMREGDRRRFRFVTIFYNSIDYVVCWDMLIKTYCRQFLFSEEEQNKKSHTNANSNSVRSSCKLQCRI